MAVSCPACGRSVKQRGLYNHLRQSTDPRCHKLQLSTIIGDLSDDGNSETNQMSLDIDDLDSDTDEDLPAFPPHNNDNHHPAAAPHVNNAPLVVDPRGDFFGNYTDMDTGDVEMEGEDMDDEEVINAEEERGLEPEHIIQPVDAGLTIEDNIVDENAHHAFQLRGGAEEPLHHEPMVEKFGGQAGEIVSRGHAGQDEAYMKMIGEGNNPFAPFSSKMEWEIARWAKLRGPSSTAFTELVKIEGVSQLLLKSSDCMSLTYHYVGC